MLLKCHWFDLIFAVKYLQNAIYIFMFSTDKRDVYIVRLFRNGLMVYYWFVNEEDRIVLIVLLISEYSVSESWCSLRMFYFIYTLFSPRFKDESNIEYVKKNVLLEKYLRGLFSQSCHNTQQILLMQTQAI